MKTIEKEIIFPDKAGQLVKYHTPFPDENPNQLYVVVEIFEYGEGIKPKATTRALNTGWSFPPTQKVLLEDLQIAEVDTTDLVGYRVSLIKEDHSKATGKVISVETDKQLVNLVKLENRVETNVKIAIQDDAGNIHHGTLLVIF